MSPPTDYQITPTAIKKAPFTARIIHYRHLGLVLSLSFCLIFIIKVLFTNIFSMTQENIRPYKNNNLFLAFDGYIDEAIFSPNPSKVIISAMHYDEKYYQLYLKSVTGMPNPSILNKLTKGELNHWLVNSGKISNRIAYVSENKTECGVYSASISKDHNLQDQQQLVSCEQYNIRDMTWSHDEKYLYILAKNKIDEEQVLPNHQTYYQIYQLEINKHSITQFSTNNGQTLSLSASPDGKWLATVSVIDNVKWHVVLFNIETKEKKHLLNTGYHINDIAWFKNSESILLSTSEGPKKLALTGQIIHLLSENTTTHTNTAALSDNNQLLLNNKSWQTTFWQYQNPILSNIKLSASYQGQSILPDINELDKYFPSYANHSHQLAYVSYRDNRTEIMIFDEKGKERQLTKQVPYDFSLTQLHWSPDDKKIMFTAHQAIYILTLDSGVIKRVTDNNYSADNPNWSADGQHIYLTSNKTGNWQIWRINSSGDNLTQITFNGGFGAKESIDGKNLYFYKQNQEGLWQKTLNSKPEEFIRTKEVLLIKDFSRFSYISWKVFKEGIYYHSFSEDNSSIHFWNFDLNSSQLIIEKNNNDINCSQFSVSHDQKVLTVLHNSNKNKLLLLNQ